MDEPAPSFLDVRVLMERSQPRPHSSWFWYGAASFVLVVLVSTYANEQSVEMQKFVHAMAAMVMLGLMAVMGVVWTTALRSQRAEDAQIEAVDELVQLRRWMEAGMILNVMLSRPARTARGRVQGLLFLTWVLARYQRWGDVLRVQEHLLAEAGADGPTEYALRLGRAMALLHETRLFDADRAISELRHDTQAADSAGLALVEIYRDVMTGHPQEAIDRFEKKLPQMRQQLGHRIADAWALAGRAYDLAGRPGEAQAAYTHASLLVPPSELERRYPELAALRGHYAAGRDAVVEFDMLTVEAAISRFRRDLTLGALLKGLLIGAAAGALILNILPIAPAAGMVLLAVIIGLWAVLSYRSVKGSRIAAESPMLIATGQYEQAEHHIEEALRTFSIFRTGKMLSLHHLAVLRHAQKRYPETALLCRTLLGQRLGVLGPLSKPSRLMLAGALLEMNDLNGAYEALAGLYRERLSLREALHLMSVQLDYEARIGAWERMLPRGSEQRRAELAELMPAAQAARAQAFMGLAALKTARMPWAQWLRGRAQLLADASQIVAERPALAELWG